LTHLYKGKNKFTTHKHTQQQRTLFLRAFEIHTEDTKEESENEALHIYRWRVKR
jgi:hypothetical protein